MQMQLIFAKELQLLLSALHHSLISMNCDKNNFSFTAAANK